MKQNMLTTPFESWKSTMFVKIKTHGFTLSDPLSDYTEAKIRLALGLFREKVHRADVFLVDVNGPKGGEDMMCKIKIKADGLNPIVAQDTSDDLYDAINMCSHKIKRVVGRRFDRMLHQRRVSASDRRLQREGHLPQSDMTQQEHVEPPM